MAWGIIMTGLMLGSMLGLLIFGLTRDAAQAMRGLPATDSADTLGLPVKQARAA
jgi:hypothetical protein